MINLRKDLHELNVIVCNAHDFKCIVVYRYQKVLFGGHPKILHNIMSKYEIVNELIRSDHLPDNT